MITIRILADKDDDDHDDDDHYDNDDGGDYHDGDGDYLQNLNYDNDNKKDPDYYGYEDDDVGDEYDEIYCINIADIIYCIKWNFFTSENSFI